MDGDQYQQMIERVGDLKSSIWLECKKNTADISYPAPRLFLSEMAILIARHANERHEDIVNQTHGEMLNEISKLAGII